MDLYIVLGVRRERQRRGHPARLQAPRPPLSPRHQPRRSRSRGALPRHPVGLRDAGRSRAAPPLRPRRAAAGGTAHAPASPASTSRRASTPSARRPSAISSAARCSRRAPPGGRSAAPISTSPLTVPLAAIVAAEPPDHRVEPRRGVRRLRRHRRRPRHAGRVRRLRRAAGSMRAARGHMVFTTTCSDLRRQRAGSRRRGARRVTAAA